MEERKYIAIDLKSFYASVECVDRALDPLKTNLVVADPSRTEKTICLAVSPSLKRYGIPGRARLFEVVEEVRKVNALRLSALKDKKFTGKEYDSDKIDADDSLEVDYIVAPPRMRRYMEMSTKIFGIYMRHIAPEDIHVYSVDEVFIDATAYLNTYGLTAHELCIKMIREVLSETGITATAGIGTNMYLCKIAMDIVAKHMPADADGVRIAELDEMSYRRLLWDHRPLTDFWRIGKGISKKLEAHGIYTQGDICRCSMGGDDDYYNEELLYRLFGVNAELIIDHAWGYEPCTIKQIKEYVPESSSVSIGQVLSEPYDFEHGRLIIKEMTDLLVLDLVGKGLMTDQMVLNVGYDSGNDMDGYEIKDDFYGRKVVKPAHGSVNLGGYTSSSREIIKAVVELYDRIVDKNLFVRRMNVVCGRVLPEKEAEKHNKKEIRQYSLFDDLEKEEAEEREKNAFLQKEKNAQKAVLELKRKFGKNAVLKGMNLEEGGTTIERNRQVGGHKA